MVLMGGPLLFLERYERFQIPGKNSIEFRVYPKKKTLPYKVHFVASEICSAGKKGMSCHEYNKTLGATGNKKWTFYTMLENVKTQPWHRFPAVDRLTKLDKKSIRILISQRVNHSNPGKFMPRVVPFKPRPPKNDELIPILKKINKLGITVQPISKLKFLRGESPAVLLRAKNHDSESLLVGVDHKWIKENFSINELPIVTKVLMTMFDSIYVVKDPKGVWKELPQ
jgi:hypothetical protein